MPNQPGLPGDYPPCTMPDHQEDGCQPDGKQGEVALSPTTGHTNACIALAWLGDRRTAYDKENGKE